MSQPATYRRAAVLPLLLAAAHAAAQGTLVSNGNYINDHGGGPGGADLSIVQSSYGYTTIGFFNHTGGGTRAADDFTVPAGQTWSVQTLRVFEFSTDSGPVSPFTAINARIWNGRPGDAGAAVIAGNATTNLLAATAAVNCYRVFDTTPGSLTRPVFSVDAAFSPPVSLPPGHYWVDWQLTYNAGSGARTVTVCPTGPASLPGANARSFTGTAWADSVDNFAGYHVEFPFELRGTGGGGACYANCDNSTTPPVLNVLDFNCFLNAFSTGSAYANCDGSTTAPALNVLDFNCFLNRFSTGCP